MKEKDTKQECMLCHAIMHKQGREYNGKELATEIYRSFKVNFELKELDDFDRNTQLFVCPKCKFEIFLPQIQAGPEFYEKLSKTKGYYPLRRWDFEQAVLDLPEKGIVLDVGCGSGVFLEMARAKGLEVIGCEENPNALETCAQKGIKTFAKLSEIKEQNLVFDAVFSFHVLEHVDNPISFIKELSSLLKPDGKLGISVPNMTGVFKYIDPCYSNMPPHHATHWQSKTIEALVMQTNTKMESVYFEPLSRMHQSYYAQEFGRRIFPQAKILRKLSEKIISAGLLLMLMAFKICRYRTFPYLYDMSLYASITPNKEG